MTRYIVFEPPAENPVTGNPPAGPSDRAVFVRDAFAKWALLFPFLWLFRHGLILAGILVVAASLALGLLAEMPELGPAAVLLPLLLGVLVALEGPSLRAWRYRRRGFREVAVVDALNEEEAAILYYAGEAAGRDAAPIDPQVFPAWQPGLGDAPRQAPRSLLDPSGYR